MLVLLSRMLIKNFCFFLLDYFMAGAYIYIIILNIQKAFIVYLWFGQTPTIFCVNSALDT